MTIYFNKSYFKWENDQFKFVNSSSRQKLCLVRLQAAYVIVINFVLRFRLVLCRQTDRVDGKFSVEDFHLCHQLSAELHLGLVAIAADNGVRRSAGCDGIHNDFLLLEILCNCVMKFNENFDRNLINEC